MTLFLLVYVCCALLSPRDQASLSSNQPLTEDAHLLQQDPKLLVVCQQHNHPPEPHDPKGRGDQSSVMSVLPGHDIDPKAPLSSGDLVRLLLSHCNSNHEESRKANLNIEAELEHTDDKIKTVIIGFGKQLSNVIEGINEQNSAQAKRIADLELKLETVSSYNQELLFSLKNGLHDVLLRIDSDMNSIWANLYSCGHCCNPSNSMSSLANHTLCSHGIVLASCTVCGKIENCEPPLPEHIDSQHAIYSAEAQAHKQHQSSHTPGFLSQDPVTPQTLRSPPNPSDVFRCHDCGKVFSNIALLNRHIELTHMMSCYAANPSFLCGFCEQTFQTISDLVHHVVSTHTLNSCSPCGMCTAHSAHCAVMSTKPTIT